jgi:alkanesulfonate monooxygenase SsuD/methylene tetrahydromethanopterin reductase-like flavin-dependent oxidoreductase (luciferase family)
LPVIGPLNEIRKGMAGKRTDLYQHMLGELSEQIRFMDTHGYYGVGFTEHHFHIEGEEVSTNPVLLDLYFAMQTERMKFGQLGIVLPAHNPVRVAEDIAMLDQMSGGRAFAGFTRGYQPRWVNVLGQQVAGMDGSIPAEDFEQLKKDLFYDHFEIIQKAWTNDTFSHDSAHWKIPCPDTHWAAAEVTRKYGQGVDEKGVLTEVGIAPGTYDGRTIELFQPFSVSQSSIEWAVANDVVPITILTNTEIARAHLEAAQETAAKAGRDLALGQRMGMTREIIVADTDEEAEAIARNAGAQIWCNFFQPFGFNAAVAGPGEDPFALPNTFETISERGLVIHGSPDTVNRKLEALFQALPCDYFWMFMYNGIVPQRAMMRHLELLTEKVWPNFTDSVH